MYPYNPCYDTSGDEISRRPTSPDDVRVEQPTGAVMPPPYTGGQPAGFTQTGYPLNGYNTQQGYPSACQPGYVGPPQTGYPIAQQPRHVGAPIQGYPTNTVVVTTQQNPQRVSFTGHIIFSCIVFWCCGWLFGLIAFVLAMGAQARSNSGDIDGARLMAKGSVIVSIIGAVVGMGVIIFIIVYYVMIMKNAQDTGYWRGY